VVEALAYRFVDYSTGREGKEEYTSSCDPMQKSLGVAIGRCTLNKNETETGRELE
jgi:hypothetical protein